MAEILLFLYAHTIPKRCVRAGVELFCSSFNGALTQAGAFFFFAMFHFPIAQTSEDEERQESTSNWWASVHKATCE